MKRVFLLITLAVWACLPCFRATAAHAAEKPGAELVRTMLKLYRDTRYYVRMQALYLSAGLAPHQALTDELRKRQTKADPAEKFAILYALAAMTHDPQDIESFLQAFPFDPCTYHKAVPSGWRFLEMWMGLPRFLLMLAYENAYQKKALQRFLTITDPWQPVLYEFGNVPRDDPLVRAYEAKYPDANYNIPTCEKISGKRWADHPNALIAPIQHLLNSEDDLSRISALRMSWAVFGNEERLAKNACISYSKRNMQSDERILYTYIFQFVACEQNFPDYATLFPVSPQDIQRLLRLQQDTYKESGVDIINGLNLLAKNKKDDKAIKKLAIALKYGKEYISKYLYETCQRAL